MTDPNFNAAYQQWCANSKQLIAECEKYAKWRRRAMHTVLTNLAPRIAALDKRMYSGCGFHYDKESRLGKIISALSVHYQWCANHCEQIPKERVTMIINTVMVRGLFQDVEEAEASAKEWEEKQKGNI